MFLPTIDDYGQQKEKMDINCELLWFGKQVKCLLPQSGVKQTQDLFTVRRLNICCRQDFEYKQWISIYKEIYSILHYKSQMYDYLQNFTILSTSSLYKVCLSLSAYMSTFIHMSNV